MIGLEKNFDSHIHIYVLFELLSHLLDPSDPNFTNCKHAILAINYHCRDSSTSEVKFINDLNSELIRYFFEDHRNETNEVYDLCARICDYILNNKDDEHLEDIRTYLECFTSVVEDTENDFIEYYRLMIDKVDPSSTGWHLNQTDRNMRRRNLQFIESNEFRKILAREEVQRLSKYANSKPIEREIDSYTNYIIENYSFALLLKIEIMRRIIESGFDFTRRNRGNWFWDIELASCVCTNEKKQNISYIFVTSDRDVLEIANVNGFGDRIISKQKYFDLLQIKL